MTTVLLDAAGHQDGSPARQGPGRLRLGHRGEMSAANLISHACCSSCRVMRMRVRAWLRAVVADRAGTQGLAMPLHGRVPHRGDDLDQTGPGYAGDSVERPGQVAGLLDALGREPVGAAHGCVVGGLEVVVLPAPLEGDAPVPCLLYTSPSPRDGLLSRMPSSA